MKKLLLLISFAFIGYFAKSQTLILAKDAPSYIGKTVTICDSVYGTKSLEKLSLINLGGSYPKELLTIVINKEDIGKFASEPASMYLGNRLCVTGTITEFKGKVQIIVNEPKQITVK